MFRNSYACSAAVNSRSAAIWAAIALLNIMSVDSIAFAQGTAEPTTTFNLEASDLVIDEGAVVQFNIEDKEYRDPANDKILELEADLSPVKWDFGDSRSDPTEAYGLYNIRHWFADDNESPYRVQASHQGTTREIAIRVNDVPPEIHSISVTDNPEKGKPVVFQVAARDPGFNDVLTFTWEFGDGATATGRNAIHQYAEAGTYQASVSVADEAAGDDGPPAQVVRFPVTVGDFYGDPEENTFSVSGDISASEAEIEAVIIAGSTGNPGNPQAGGACQIRVEMRSGQGNMGVTLTARLNPGFTPGNYSIGETTEWDGAHQDDINSPGSFFAEFIPPEDEVWRNVGGRKSGGPFWSDTGRVTVTRFDEGVLEIFFEAAFTENIPANFDPRRVSVRGMLSTSLSASTSGNLIAYYCGGEEPEEFELVNSDPEANAVNYKFEEAAVALIFSQIVDPDSIVDAETLEDNLALMVRLSSGQLGKMEGSWMIWKENPKVVRFIPQSRLMPGTIYCVFVNGGESGLRSFTGSILAGTTLEAPSDRMAQACGSAGDSRVGYTFATQVELESLWVDVYQGSLIGKHSKLVKSPAVVRTYAWWQNASRRLHPTAQVREFPARVFGVANRLPVGRVENVIKRPDGYSDADRRNMLHTTNLEWEPAQIGGGDLFAVIQLLTKDGAAIEPVIQSVPLQLGTLVEGTGAAPDLDVLTIDYMVICETGLAEELCPLDATTGGTPGYDGFSSEFEQLAGDIFPVHAVSQHRVPGLEYIVITPDCPGGEVYNGEHCLSTEAPFNPDTLATYLSNAQTWQGLWQNREVVIIFLAGTIDGGANITQINYPADESPVLIYGRGFPKIAIVRSHPVNTALLIRNIAIGLLGEDACRFRGDAVCDNTPVQGLRTTTVSNRHHAEGNGDSGRLIPLLKGGAGPYNDSDFHISAYNYSKLYDALMLRHDQTSDN